MNRLITGEEMLSALGPPTAYNGTCVCGQSTVEYQTDEAKVSWCAAGHVYVVDPNKAVVRTLVYTF